MSGASSRIKRPEGGATLGGGALSQPPSQSASQPTGRRAPQPPDLFDIALYAPIGFLTQFRKLLPELVQSGRSQVALVKMVGTMAARRATGSAPAPAKPAKPAAPVVSPPAATTVADEQRPSEVAPAKKLASKAAPAKKTAAKKAPAKKAPARKKGAARREFPIAGYETLPASAVVALLGSLDAIDREAVKVHELANRRRRTILTRLSQLEAGS
jgi:hypothetical protein